LYSEASGLISICIFSPFADFTFVCICDILKAEQTKEVHDMVKLLIRAGTLLLSLAFRIAAKLRLTLPLLYILAAGISTLFTDWVSLHEEMTLWGLYALLGLSALSWFCTLAKFIRTKNQERFSEDDIAWQVRRAREKGVPLDAVRFSGSAMLDPRTGMPVDFGAGH
jgi:hypothetical protein